MRRQARITRYVETFEEVAPETVISFSEAANALGVSIQGLYSLMRARRLTIVEDAERLESTRNRSYMLLEDFERLKAERGGD